MIFSIHSQGNESWRSSFALGEESTLFHSQALAPTNKFRRFGYLVTVKVWSLGPRCCLGANEDCRANDFIYK
jgi:hypothetical protein